MPAEQLFLPLLAGAQARGVDPNMGRAGEKLRLEGVQLPSASQQASHAFWDCGGGGGE